MKLFVKHTSLKHTCWRTFDAVELGIRPICAFGVSAGSLLLTELLPSDHIGRLLACNRFLMITDAVYLNLTLVWDSSAPRKARSDHCQEILASALLRLTALSR